MLDNLTIRESMFSLERDAGQLPVFVAGPAEGIRCPALIVVHEIFGLDEHIMDVARRFARHGIRVFAPDLFACAPDLPADRTSLEAMRAVWQNIPDSDLIADLRALLAKIRRLDDVHADKIGAIGYCMGGAIALMFACEAPELAFVVDYYGRIYYPQLSKTKPKHPIEYLNTLRCPLLGIFAGQDQLIGAEHVQEFTKKLEQLNRSFQIKVYPGASHAFFNDRREFYLAEAADDAWLRTLDFIKNASANSST